MKSVVLSKYKLRFFIFKFDLNVEYRSYFLNKSHGLQNRNIPLMHKDIFRRGSQKLTLSYIYLYGKCEISCHDSAVKC